MKFTTFLVASLAVLLLCVLAAIGIVADSVDRETSQAVATGIGLAYLNAILGYAIISWGFEKPPRQFMVSFFGGMIFRFLLIFLTLFVLIRALKMLMVPLTASLVTAYFAFLCLEVMVVYWNANKNEAQRGI